MSDSIVWILLLLVLSGSGCSAPVVNEPSAPVKASEPVEAVKDLPRFQFPWAYEGHGRFTAVLPITDLSRENAPCAVGTVDGPQHLFISEFDKQSNQMKRARIGFMEHLRREWKWAGKELQSTPYSTLHREGGRIARLDTHTFVEESTCSIEYADANRYVMTCTTDEKYGKDAGATHEVYWEDDIAVVVQDIREWRDSSRFRVVTWFRFNGGKLEFRKIIGIEKEPADLPPKSHYWREEALAEIRAVEVPSLDVKTGLQFVLTDQDGDTYGDLFFIRPHPLCIAWDEVRWLEDPDGDPVEYSDEDVAPVPPAGWNPYPEASPEGDPESAIEPPADRDPVPSGQD